MAKKAKGKHRLGASHMLSSSQCARVFRQRPTFLVSELLRAVATSSPLSAARGAVPLYAVASLALTHTRLCPFAALTTQTSSTTWPKSKATAAEQPSSSFS
jgi:hypothetical protein